MKLFTWLCAGAALFFAASCQTASGGSEADTTEARGIDTSVNTGVIYTIDTTGSKIEWMGSKLIGDAHSGIVPIASGDLRVDEGNLVGGRMILDMKRLEALDQDTSSNVKLTSHLSSGDFFNVDSFPTAQFDIIDVVKKQSDTSMVSGNLTIKGITKNISFPAKIIINGNDITISTVFVLDRTKWGVNYGSENSIKDKIISKEVQFTGLLKAVK